MSGGDVDDEPSLSSRNALGSGNRELKFSNGEWCKIAVGCGSWRWFAKGNIENDENWWWWSDGL
jgi:hypothetical protein